MANRIFDFDGPRGATLAGRLEAPEATPRGWAILAHCFTCGKDNLAAVRVTRALSRAGIGALRFDFAGVGGSTGDFRDSSFATDIDDLTAAAAAMTKAGMPVSLIVGHSLGGAAAIAAAARLPQIRAVATIGAPADVAHVLHWFDPQQLAKVQAEGAAEVAIAGRPFVIRRSFVEEIGRHDIEQCARELHRPLLVMHAPRDEVVGIEHASRIFLAAKHPKSFISLDSADHFLSGPDDANYAAGMIAAWASRYLPMLLEDMPQVERARGVVARETGRGALQVEIESGSHRLLADEPISVGGLGSGLSPYDLVSAGLAACTAMTMRLYAKRHGVPLQRAEVAVDHSKVPHMSPSDRFTRIIALDGPLDADQRARLLAIAERCPVDLTLVRGSDIQTRLAGNDQATPSSLFDQD